jgi:murein DD-endopeptidase MepM/ murein hydrolase activator NlpD
MTVQPGTGAPAAQWPRGRGSLEIQLHPADIRRRVRYFFFGRRQMTALSLALLAYLLFLALAAALAPRLVRQAAGPEEYQLLVSERMHQGQRMQGLVRRLGELAERGADLDLQLARVRLAYGLPAAAAPAAAVPLAAAAPQSIYAGTVLSGRRLTARLERGLGAASASLAGLERYEREHSEEVATTPSVCPLPAGSFVLTAAFARARSPFTGELAFHPGIDLAAPAGTPVHAPADAVVSFAGTYPEGMRGGWWRFGKLVILAHGGRWATVFGHLDRIDVRPGQRVRRGHVLGTVGSSRWSTHPHLHYEVRRLGAGGERPLDPRLFVLDQRWPGEERLLAQATAGAPPNYFDPLPAPRRRARRGR